MPRPNQTKKLCIAILTLVVAFSLAFPLGITYPSVCKAELILKFKPGTTKQDQQALLDSYSLEVLEEVPKLGVLVVAVPESVLFEVKAALASNPMVEFVEENVKISCAVVPNDYYYSLQWHLQKIGMCDAWDISRGDSKVVIAVLDTGVDLSHPDLTGKFLQGYNVYDGSSNVLDDVGHGTMVAGVAAAITNNGLGVSAPAWNNLILPVKVNVPGTSYTTFSLLAKGLIYAADRGARVACISWQIFNGSGALYDAARYFAEKGGVVVAAAGNTGKLENYMDNSYIISVSATDKNDLVASFSSYGQYVDLSAPGVGIFTTISGAKASSYEYAYGYASGTSFSAPIVAGVAALMCSVNSSLEPIQIEQLLESSAVDLGSPGYDQQYGWGRIDAARALRAASLGVLETQPDLTAPSVAIMSPKAGTVVYGRVLVSVNATDNRGVSKVELYKDGKLFASDSTAPYEFVWDTTMDADGTHTLQAKAYDASNNVGLSDAVTVKVQNTLQDKSPPTVSITSPRNRMRVSGTVQVQVSAGDDTGISRVEFYIDGKLVASDAESPYTYVWDTKGVKNGWHTITVKAYDLSGKSSTATLRVYVYNSYSRG